MSNVRALASDAVSGLDRRGPPAQRLASHQSPFESLAATVVAGCPSLWAASEGHTWLGEKSGSRAFEGQPPSTARLSFPLMSALTPLPNTPLGRYRHYKGGEYEVIGVARHSETLEPLVVYRPLYNDSGWWVRPNAMFFGEVEVNSQLQPRFVFAGHA
jgi:hypothetical protein